MYVYKDNKKLRCGYTTGSCAAAAAKAGAIMLLTKNKIDSVTINIGDIPTEFKLSCAIIEENFARAEIIKDSGDDPDITNGTTIAANVSIIPDGVVIDGGIGIGRVTKPGLKVAVGEAAINPVPRSMIEAEVKDVIENYGALCGFKVIIEAPQGEALAKKTFNGDLGIVGGISILGTTGIVEPMSDDAMIATIETEIKMWLAEGRKTILVTPGNYGDIFIKDNFTVNKTPIKCSNYIGDAISLAGRLGAENMLLVGHIGKLVKLGAGIFNTHSKYGDARIDTLISCALTAGADNALLFKIKDCVTTDDAVELLKTSGFLEGTLDVLSKRIRKNIDKKKCDSLRVEYIVFSGNYGKLFSSAGAYELLNELTDK